MKDSRILSYRKYTKYLAATAKCWRQETGAVADRPLKEAANRQLLSEQPAVRYAVDKQARSLSFARLSSEPSTAKIATRLYIW